MQVREVRLSNFMSHKKTLFEIAPQGVTLVQGPNGSGKSAVLDAISWAFLGSTLRGTNPMPPDVKHCQVEVVLSDGTVLTRRTEGRKTIVFWSDTDQYATATKAQEAILSRFGDMSLDIERSFFSSDDTDAFTGASNAARKQYLERSFRLDKYEDAYRRALADMRIAEKNVAACEAKVEHAHLYVQTTEQDVLRGKETYEHYVSQSPEPPGPEPARLSPSLQADHDRSVREASFRVLDTKAQLSEAQKALALVQSGHCATCGQETDAVLGDYEERVAGLKLAVEAATQAEALERKAATDYMSSRRQAEDAHRAWQAQKASHDQAKTYLDAQAQTLEDLRGRVKAAKRAWLDAMDTLDEAIQQRDTLQAACTVLGPKGIRSAILQDVLSALAANANGYLTAWGSEFKVSLHPWRKKKDGSTSDVIDFQIHGRAGGGQGYKATSRGERRKTDLAMLLGHVDLLGSTGLLAFDECFDNLDTATSALVAEELRKFAQERQVLVVTHRPDFASLLNPSRSYEFVGPGRLAP